ncbi:MULTISPECIES: M20 family metallopeptidase [unclassified Sedimentibacter]|uniref:M20 family metallopeptidase n=1 Tax=unclassified Sedimentibacter TaxID=2649220 RepID=UPI0027E1C496|nr:M20/M25/M40 family metallo-hydrolase [Sedimentibacter sp. MB35-C1]WMJ78202.1 M20/M25/M40 family metallo-hydrolase [Sedimentibacter sp. MB35-C1]
MLNNKFIKNTYEDEQEAIELLDNLIRIKSKFFHEEEIMSFVFNWLKKNNIDVNFHYYEDKKVTGFKGTNLIGSIEGSEDGPVILLNCHLDTVGECTGWTKDPYIPVIENGKMYGLGALDMKSGCAAALISLKKFSKTVKDFKGKIIYSFVSDEEGPYGLGTSFSIKDNLYEGAEMALSLEPSSGFSFTDNHSICLGARGGYQYKIRLFGKSSHAATPENGISAIEDASKLIIALKNVEPKYHDKLGHSSTCVTSIKSSGSGCSVADYSEIEIFKHIVIGENKQSIIEEVHKAANNAKIKSKYEIIFRDDPLEASGGFMPYVTDENLEEVRILESLIKECSGQEPMIKYFSSIGDFNLIAERLDIPVLIFGPSGGNFHSFDEYVNLNSFLETIEIVYNYLTRRLSL